MIKFLKENSFEVFIWVLVVGAAYWIYTGYITNYDSPAGYLEGESIYFQGSGGEDYAP